MKIGVQILRPENMLEFSRSPSMPSHPKCVHLTLLFTLVKAVKKTGLILFPLHRCGSLMGRCSVEGAGGLRVLKTHCSPCCSMEQ